MTVVSVCVLTMVTPGMTAICVLCVLTMVTPGAVLGIFIWVGQSRGRANFG